MEGYVPYTPDISIESRVGRMEEYDINGDAVESTLLKQGSNSNYGSKIFYSEREVWITRRVTVTHQGRREGGGGGGVPGGSGTPL